MLTAIHVRCLHCAQRVELPFLFVSSVAKLQSAIDSAFGEDFGGRFLAYLHVVTTSPTFLLPDPDQQQFAAVLRTMLVEARQMPRLHIKVAWEHYGPALVTKVKAFLDCPGSFDGVAPLPKEGSTELDGIVSLLACFSEFATSAAKTHFLSHDFAEELLRLLRQAMRPTHAVYLTFWAQIMILQVLSRFVSGSHIVSFYSGREENEDLLTTMGTLAAFIAERVISLGGGAPTESAENCAAALPTTVPVEYEDLHLGLVEILQCCTTLCSSGPLDSRLFIRNTLKSSNLMTSVVEVLRLPSYASHANYNLVLQTARFLAVWPCRHRGALVAICYWMLIIPYDCIERSHPGELVVSLNRTSNVGSRLHHTLFEAVLAQLAVTAEGEAGLLHLLTIPLLSTWASLQPLGSDWWAKSIFSSDLQLHEFDTLVKTTESSTTASDNATTSTNGSGSDIGDWRPNALWAFASGPDGAEVVASLLDLACRGQIADVLTPQVMWTTCYTVHTMVVEMEKRWKQGPAAVPKLFVCNYIECQVARGAYSLLPTLMNIAEGWTGDARPAMLSHLPSAEYARRTIHRLLGPPSVFMIDLESDCSAIMDYLIEELCLLTADTFADTLSHSHPQRHDDEHILGEYKSALKSLLLLVSNESPVKADAVQRLAAEPTFIETIAEILKASRAVTNATSKSATKEAELGRKKRLTSLGSDLTAYALAFLWHHEICASLYTARGINVYTVISPLTELVDLYVSRKFHSAPVLLSL